MEASVAGLEWIKLKKIDPHCFACGFENKHGLNMTFESNGERLRCQVEVPSHLRGWHNLVHGGVISTMIDEAMSWSAIALLKKFILTKSMIVNFQKPIIISTRLMVYGFIVEQHSDRAVTMAAEIYDEDGSLCASGQGEFVLFTEEQFARLGVLDKDQLAEMKKTIGG